jgi:flagellar motility protein MotE (MotC chaperone)
MKRFLVYGLAGTMLFAASATVSLWSQQQQAKAKGKAEPDSEGHATRAGTKEKESGKSGHEGSKSEGGEELRPLVRSSGPPNAEETARLANSLRDRMKAVREREEQVGSRQKQLELIYQDIRGERNVLDELRKQVADEMKALNAKLDTVDHKFGELEQQRQSVSKSQADVQKQRTDIDTSERKNIDRMATMYDSMQPDSAARILQQMADNGKLDTAVKLLAQMKERQAAKVLAELSDASLAAQLLEKMRNLKRPTVGGITPAGAPPAVTTSSPTVPSTENPR